eukprot:CAMPEP_0185019224 /NCGR_PEP_ID=MMETSP1103-20130426/1857_1 /TAXON_ID=36769 /ORGANISM="Paraphysomonas bandaiensis, Strain Caron Lab Isolate" /LENGTH=263 /DNA_ID=CAMNT_0027549425 /DNA_START=1239 /DNA_END=2030 /DNA_ORIENTATION=-
MNSAQHGMQHTARCEESSIVQHGLQQEIKKGMHRGMQSHNILSGNVGRVEPYPDAASWSTFSMDSSYASSSPELAGIDMKYEKDDQLTMQPIQQLHPSSGLNHMMNPTLSPGDNESLFFGDIMPPSREPSSSSIHSVHSVQGIILSPASYGPDRNDVSVIPELPVLAAIPEHANVTEATSPKMHADDIRHVALATWLPDVFQGYPEDLVHGFIMSIVDEGFLCVQDLISAHDMGDLSFEYLSTLGFKRGHYTRLTARINDLKT